MAITADDFKAKYGPWAVITGTTSGIGKSLAEKIAVKGLNLAIIARRIEILEKQATIFKKELGIEVKIIKADLSDPTSTSLIIRETANLDIGLFVPNAGVEVHGRFTENSFEEERQMLQINVVSTLELIHHFARKLSKRGNGGILVVSSMSGFFGNGFLSGYAATKAYLINLGESLHYEMKDQGVKVSVLAPGLTDTEMAHSVSSAQLKKPPMMTADEVAEIGLKKFGRIPVIVPGAQNRFIIFLTTRIFGRRRAARSSTAFLRKFFKIEEV